MTHKSYATKDFKEVQRVTDIIRDSSPIICTQVAKKFEYLDELENQNITEVLQDIKYTNENNINYFVDYLSSLGIRLRYEDVSYSISCQEGDHFTKQTFFETNYINKDDAWDALISIIYDEIRKRADHDTFRIIFDKKKYCITIYEDMQTSKVYKIGLNK